MRRADRLFQLTLLLSRGRVLTGDQLSERLGVSRRTVYRDIDDLSRFGARLVQSCADEGLHAAADGVLAKIHAVLPSQLKPKLDDPGLLVPDFRVSPEVKRALRELRGAVSGHRLVTFRYTQGNGAVITPRVRALPALRQRHLDARWLQRGRGRVPRVPCVSHPGPRRHR